jgi:hypothetical protein
MYAPGWMTAEIKTRGKAAASLFCRDLVSERSDCEQLECGRSSRPQRWFGACLPYCVPNLGESNQELEPCGIEIGKSQVRGGNSF